MAGRNSGRSRFIYPQVMTQTASFIGPNFLLGLSIPNTNIVVKEPTEVAARSATTGAASPLLHKSLLALHSQFTDKREVTHFQKANLYISGNSSISF
jgi:hypothetical protein